MHSSAVTTVPSQPVVAPGYTVLELDNGAVALRRWNRTLVLRGQAAQWTLHILAALDGSRDAAQLAMLLMVDANIVGEVLRRLAQARIIVDAADVLAPDNPAWGAATLMEHLAPQDTGSHAVYRRLAHQTVALVGNDNLVELVKAQLSASGVGHTLVQIGLDQLAALRQCAPQIVIHVSRCADYYSAVQINDQLLRSTIPWLSAWVEGSNLLVTPVMVPGETACFECLLQRQRGNYANPAVDAAYEQQLRSGLAQQFLYIDESSCSIDTLLVSLVATRALGHLAGMRPIRVPKLTEFSLTQLESRQHPVLRLPQCPACSPAALQQSAIAFSRRVAPRMEVPS